MSDEKMQVLEMVRDGRINSEQAVELLEALDDEATPQKEVEISNFEAENGSNGGGFWDWVEGMVSMIGPKETYREELSWTVDAEAEAIAKIIAHTNNGTISVTGAEQTTIAIKAEKVVKASSEEKAAEFASQVQLDVEHLEGELKIYKKHPRPPMGIEVIVHYGITCPREMALKLQTSNGKLKVEDINGTVETHSSNGKIILESISGPVSAKTSNGKIRANIVSAQEQIKLNTSNGAIDLSVQNGQVPIIARTSNGAIKLDLPADFSGQLKANTSNGSVNVEGFNLSQRAKHQLSAQLGEGGETEVNLMTNNGVIRVGVVK